MVLVSFSSLRIRIISAQQDFFFVSIYSNLQSLVFSGSLWEEESENGFFPEKSGNVSLLLLISEYAKLIHT